MIGSSSITWRSTIATTCLPCPRETSRLDVSASCATARPQIPKRSSVVCWTSAGETEKDTLGGAWLCSMVPGFYLCVAGSSRVRRLQCPSSSARDNICHPTTVTTFSRSHAAHITTGSDTIFGVRMVDARSGLAESTDWQPKR